MFGPNAKATADPKQGYFHHRQPAYRELLRDTERLLHERLGIPDAFECIFLTGSGTLANEAVISSVAWGSWRVHPAEGEFHSRLRRLAHTWWDRNHTPHGAQVHHAMVAYETAEARQVAPCWPLNQVAHDGVRFADCISSFPYYELPRGANIFTTVSSKQLGALPVLSIVGVHADYRKWLLTPDDGYSYLNLSRYFAARRDKGESPHTPAMALLWDLYQELQEFDVERFRARVDSRRRMLESIFRAKDMRGEGPVLCVRHGAIPEAFGEAWNLYRAATGDWQFFLYSGGVDDYEEFLETYWDILQHGGIKDAD